MLYSLAIGLERLLQPVAILWLIALAVTLRLICRRRWRSAALFGAGTLMAWIVGATPFSTKMLASLEAPYEIRDWSKLPEADAVLMLGGTLSPSPPDLLKFEVGGTFDRALTAIELVRRHKAGTLVLSGGGDSANPGFHSEAALLLSWVREWNLSPVPVHDLGVSRDTHEEAGKMSALMKEKNWKSILLVTSASHMRRAEGVFRTAGVTVIPVACDFAALNMSRAGSGFHFVPGLRSFQNFETFLHEWYGIIYYRARGWIR